MAKEDFCFTYYDGDATRDTSHMNRLERGAYHDIVIAQRKFGRLTIGQIKKILGKDFDECWPSLELVLKFAGNLFYIEWLDKSIIKSREHAAKQQKNAAKRYNSHYQPSTNDLPKSDLAEPLKDGDGDKDGIGDELGNEDKNFGKSENLFLIPQMFKVFKSNNPKYLGNKERDSQPLLSIAGFLCEQGGLAGSPETHQGKVLEVWEQLSRVVASDNFYRQKSLSTISNHIQEISQIAQDGSSKNGRSSKVSRQQVNEAFAKRHSRGKQPGG